MNMLNDMAYRPEHLRQPSWRWLVAMDHAFSMRPEENDIYICPDDDLREGVNFYKARLKMKRHPAAYMTSHAATHEAFLLHTAEGRLGGYRWILEALLMTPATDEEIATVFPLANGPAVIRVYRRMFFDVDSYRGNKIAILGNVLSTAQVNGSGVDDSDYLWKLFAYEWGFDAFNDFISFRCGHRLARRYTDWFNDITQSQVLQHGLMASGDVRTLYTEEALNLVSVLARNWDVSDEQRQALENRQHTDVAKQIAMACQMLMLDGGLERRVAANTEAREPRSGFNYTVLTPRGGQLQLSAASKEGKR